MKPNQKVLMRERLALDRFNKHWPRCRICVKAEDPFYYCPVGYKLYSVWHNLYDEVCEYD